MPATRCRSLRTLRGSVPYVIFAVLVATLASGCARVALPRLPSLGNDDEPPATVSAPAVDVTATPRDLLTARLANPRANPDTPGMTVGKLIEFADRYLACDCASTRFVRAWEKTAEGYRALTNSGAVRPLEFVCRETDAERECFLTEIDRGARTGAFTERFVPGSEFIQFLYDHGVACERTEPCPADQTAPAAAATSAPIVNLREAPAD